MNPLDSRPKLREAAYLIQWIVNLVLGIASIVLVALSQNPLWWVIVQAVFNFVWTYLGITAQSNVTQNTDYDENDDYIEPEVEDAQPSPVADTDPDRSAFVDESDND